ncbi:hypothetical protein QCN32_gp23 [Arthrobacter phage Niktson]|uniref:Minor tail protein n=1 Tax=Arthrobacter phage Niktson TaxID=2014347 RepID=A0A218M5J6_9CAUD|nr:hypothetical protein QCN32_gp23 [Arthrobacter phage Niktson]ASD52248.1 hypothetical protein NIKTSON_23 [Arthrobacter phage Niktson]ASD52341.1 hypothetical protein ELEPHANTMAN_23 [Arthrobacter phage ElephantMan]
MAQTPDDPTKAQVWITKGIDDLDFEFYIPQGPKGDPGPFVPVSVLGASGTNLNDLATPGLYSVAIPVLAMDSALQNYPMHEAGTMMVSTSNAGSVVVQQYMTNTKGMYVRRKFSGTWNAWRFFGHSRTDQSAGRVMYQWDELNQREQLTYGDTGWRDMTPMSGTAGWLRLRRIQNIIYVWAGAWVNGTSSDILALPAGFQTGTNSFVGQFGDRLGSPVPVNINGPSSLIQAPASASALSFCVNFPTVNAWPASLPGTAHAAIPNS